MCVCVHICRVHSTRCAPHHHSSYARALLPFLFVPKYVYVRVCICHCPRVPAASTSASTTNLSFLVCISFIVIIILFLYYIFGCVFSRAEYPYVYIHTFDYCLWA